MGLTHYLVQLELSWRSAPRVLIEEEMLQEKTIGITKTNRNGLYDAKKRYLPLAGFVG